MKRSYRETSKRHKKSMHATVNKLSSDPVCLLPHRISAKGSPNVDVGVFGRTVTEHRPHIIHNWTKISLSELRSVLAPFTHQTPTIVGFSRPLMPDMFTGTEDTFMNVLKEEVSATSPDVMDRDIY